MAVKPHNKSQKKRDIPVVIFCGGKGTRLREETTVIPKPLVRVGDKPILWHIMKMYHVQGFRRFILLLGYKGEKIKEYFSNYVHYTSDFTLMSGGKKGHARAVFHTKPSEDWEITFVETGLETQTGGRLKRAAPYIESDTFLLTYGDGVADVDIRKLLDTHKKHQGVATMTGVMPPVRFGEILMQDGKVVGFSEKPKVYSGQAPMLINGGFFAIERRLLSTLSDDPALVFEKQVLPELASNSQLAVNVHEGYWQCMDTIRDMEVLNEAWDSGRAPWKIWP